MGLLYVLISHLPRGTDSMLSVKGYQAVESGEIRGKEMHILRLAASA